QFLEPLDPPGARLIVLCALRLDAGKCGQRLGVGHAQQSGDVKQAVRVHLAAAAAVVADSLPSGAEFLGNGVVRLQRGLCPQSVQQCDGGVQVRPSYGNAPLR
ncbi:hypothetical protein CV014_28805, partial [Nostoc sp. CMAA1605]|nr:hypothetical protein [Nostoc sp. CMAA1605]